MLDKLKNLYELKKKSEEMRRKMAGVVVEIEERGIKIVIRGDQKLEEIVIDGEANPRVKEAINKALKEVQKKAAKKVQGDLGDLGLPGL